MLAVIRSPIKVIHELSTARPDNAQSCPIKTGNRKKGFANLTYIIPSSRARHLRGPSRTLPCAVITVISGKHHCRDPEDRSDSSALVVEMLG